MNIKWVIGKKDIANVHSFIDQHQNAFVSYRVSRNIKRQGVNIDKNSILKTIAMCLLTSQQRSGPKSAVGIFLQKKSFPFTTRNISNQNNIKEFVSLTLKENGLNRFRNKIPQFFTDNYNYLQETNWQLLKDLKVMLNGKPGIANERFIAEIIHDTFNGFGPKQSRNFLQALGLSKYEIPIDSRITKWLNEFGFPVTLSSTALQDKNYYNFVLDGIQLLCEHAAVYPCILDAAIFSSVDMEEGDENNFIY